MISKERLEELIEQGATIYTSGYRESCCFKNEIIVDLTKLDYFNKTKTYSIKDFGGGDFVLLTGYTCDNGCDEYLTPDELFETQEEAEWHKEFGCILKIERLWFPTWESVYNDLKDYKDGDFYILDNDHFSFVYNKCYITPQLFLYTRNEKFNWNANKENYYEACKLAKKIFLGERE